MNKFTIPAILVVTVLVAGIFAFMPVEKASTVHTTLGSSTQSTNILNAQLNNVKTTFQVNMDENATASCIGGGGFLVYWTFTNATRNIGGTSDTGIVQGLGIHNKTGSSADIAIGLTNQTSISGVYGGLSGEIVIFTGNSSSGEGGTQSFEDTGDLAITVVCQSGSTASTTP